MFESYKPFNGQVGVTTFAPHCTLVQNNGLYRCPLKYRTLAELVLTPQSFKRDFLFFSRNMRLNGTSGTIYF